MMRRSAALALICCVIAGSADAQRAIVGSPAPPFEGADTDGKHVSLEDLRGNVVIVNFWATWCAPCRVELPLLDGYMRAREKNGLRVVAVTMDARTVPSEVIKALQGKLSLPLLTAFRGDYGPIHRAIPTNYVIDRAGVVRYAKEGDFTLDKLNQVLVPLLNEPVPSGPSRP